MDVSISSDSRFSTSKYKTVMSILRRAFSLRSRRDSSSSNDTMPTSNNSIIVSSFSGIDRMSNSPISSDVASTSRDSLSIAPDAPSVYEDPFIAVTADGVIHVKYYYDFNPRIEFRPEDIRTAHVKKLSRVIRIARLRAVHYAEPEQCTSTDVCKPWGITRNDVWWASHLNRQLSVNEYCSVVLDDGMTIRAGCSVVNLEAFLSCLRFFSLSEDCRILHGLPIPPINRCKIPYIDEDDEDEETNSVPASTT